MIKVSVILPVYNMGKYLEECLISIFNQTLEELEVICIDDGSTDNSPDVLNKYKTRYSNMFVLTQKNSGQGIARNAGIKLAKGEFLMFVDPDDYLPSNDVLEILYTKAKANNVVVCGGNITTSTDGSGLEFFDVIYEKYKIENEGMYQFKEYQYVGAHQRYIFKTDFLIQNELFYPDYRRGQDMPFLARVLNCAKEFYLINKNVYAYRRSHKEERFTLKKANDLIMSYCDVLNLAIDNNLRELFDWLVESTNNFAKRYWYSLLKVNNGWNKIGKVNKIIEWGNVVFGYEKETKCLMSEDSYAWFAEDVKKEWIKSEEIVAKNKKIAIYGTGEVGRRTRRYLNVKGYDVDCFVVSGKKANEYEIEGIPIIPLDKLNNFCDYLFIPSALSEEVKKEMKEQLNHKGINNILDFDCDIVGCLGD